MIIGKVRRRLKRKMERKYYETSYFRFKNTNDEVKQNAIDTGIAKGSDFMRTAYVTVQDCDNNDKIKRPQDISLVDFVFKIFNNCGINRIHAKPPPR